MVGTFIVFNANVRLVQRNSVLQTLNPQSIIFRKTLHTTSIAICNTFLTSNFFQDITMLGTLKMPDLD